MSDLQTDLKRQNYILQATLENNRDVLICSLDRQYRYLVFNTAFAQAARQAYGIEISQGMSLFATITNEADRQKAKQSCDRALAGETHLSLESYGSLQRHHYEIRFSPILGPEGNVEGLTILASNITARKIAEEKLMLLNSEFDNFSYSVTHDLRAPLRSINGYAGIMLEDFSETLNEEGKKSLRIICRSVDKINLLIDDLLAFSRLGRKELIPETVNMTLLAKNVVEELSIKYPKAREIIHIGHLELALADRDLLRVVWLELLGNALKFSRNRPRPQIEAGCTERADDIAYYVKDNGVGFAMDYHAKLFNIFERLHAEHEFEGTGVGLASVQKIMKRHGGSVWTQAAPDRGATFFFSLPKNRL